MNFGSIAAFMPQLVASPRRALPRKREPRFLLGPAFAGTSGYSQLDRS